MRQHARLRCAAGLAVGEAFAGNETALRSTPVTSDVATYPAPSLLLLVAFSIVHPPRLPFARPFPAQACHTARVCIIPACSMLGWFRFTPLPPAPPTVRPFHQSDCAIINTTVNIHRTGETALTSYRRVAILCVVLAYCLRFVSLCRLDGYGAVRIALPIGTGKAHINASRRQDGCGSSVSIESC